MTTSQIRPGRKLRIARVIADLQQEELAERVGVHQTFISLLENGKRTPTPEMLGKLADALGCDVPAIDDGQAAAKGRRQKAA